jgi:hypothetical protein
VSFEKNEIVWVVVLVLSGIPVLAEVYLDEETAQTREQFLREDINLDYDETGIFEVRMGEKAYHYS